MPLVLVLFSVLTRFLFSRGGVAGQRPEETPPRAQEILKIHTDVALGVLSFVVWGWITHIQQGRITINDRLELTASTFFILFLLDLLVVFAANAVAKREWLDSDSELPIFRWFTGSRKESTFDALMLGVTLFFFLPVALASPIPPPPTPPAQTRMHIVVIPYRDASIGAQVGRERWGDRRVCEVQFVRSETEEAARSEALRKMGESGGVAPLFPERANGNIPVVDSEYVVASAFQ